MSKHTNIALRVTLEEREDFKRVALAHNLSISDYIRLLHRMGKRLKKPKGLTLKKSDLD